MLVGTVVSVFSRNRPVGQRLEDRAQEHTWNGRLVMSHGRIVQHVQRRLRRQVLRYAQHRAGYVALGIVVNESCSVETTHVTHVLWAGTSARSEERRVGKECRS